MQIAVYVTGGIAAYKAVQVVRNLQKLGHTVRVGMTKNAEHFVGSQTFAALTKYPVLDDLWNKENEAKISHIELAKWTQAAIVVPASADIISKLANGIADDSTTTTLLATSASKFIVPAMNDNMWNNPATIRNMQILKQDGYHILEPKVGYLAEGYKAKGRMAEPDEISKWVENYFDKNNKLKGKKIIITAGGTIEPIDPVRYISNYSSGKMGIALAKAASLYGAQVTLIYGKVTVSLPQDPNIKLISIKTSQELLKAVQSNFIDADILIMAAAVADYRVVNQADQKIKKHGQKLLLELTPNPDILKKLAENKKQNQIIIGFAAETENLINNARAKLIKKNVDWIIANDVSKNVFGNDNDEVTILRKDEPDLSLPNMSKQKIARKVMDLLVK